MADALSPLRVMDQSVPVGPQLLRVLRNMITHNDWAPGARLSEAEVAKAFGVSRQPVREAFIKLAEEGLVEIRPQRGTFVRKISASAVMDARFVREAIEADVIRLVAQEADPAVLKDLNRLIEAQRKVAENDPRSFVPLDDAFHRTLAEAAGKTYAWGVIESLKSQMDRVRQLSTRSFPMARLIGQHESAVGAIAAGDPAAAESAMRKHLRAILTDLPLIRESLPEYFED
jgi:GntR family transcriptional regulator, rspAB operon transcriptional repressor